MRIQTPERGAQGREPSLLTEPYATTLSAFLRSMLAVLIPLSLLAFSGYVLLAAVGRVLPRTDYAALVSLIACVVILSVPAVVLQAVTANPRVSSERRGNKWAAGGAKSLPLLAVSLVILSLTPTLDTFLRVDNLAATVLLAPCFLLSGIAGLTFARIRRDGSDRAILATALLRSVGWAGGAVALVKAGLGVPGPLLAILGTEGLLIVLAWSGLGKGDLKGPQSPSLAKGTLVTLKPTDRALAIALVGSLWLAGHIDAVLAPHYLPPPRATLYEIGWATSRLFVLPLAAFVWVVLRAMAAREKRPNVTRWLRLSLAIAASGALVTIAIAGLLREQILTLLFGHGAEHAASLAVMFDVTAGLLVINAIMIQFHLNVRSHAHLLVLSALVLQIVLIHMFHGTGREMALVAMGAAALCTVFLYHAVMAISRWPTPLSALSPHEEFIPAEGPISNRSQVQLSIVLPCHNSGPQLETFMLSLQRILHGQVPNELIIVSDGSTDDTVRIAGEFASDSVRVFHYPIRLGKGHALRVGLHQARGDFVTFIDSDGDIDPSGIVPFLSLMKLYDPDIVLASKRHPLSRVEYPRVRRMMSWVYHLIGRFLFHINVRDTQTGLKMIRRDVLAAVLPRMLEKRYAFDLELLVVARRLGFTRVFEAPVKIGYRFTSNVKPTTALLILVDTAAIFYRLYILNSYVPHPPMIDL